MDVKTRSNLQALLEISAVLDAISSGEELSDTTRQLLQCLSPEQETSQLLEQLKESLGYQYSELYPMLVKEALKDNRPQLAQQFQRAARQSQEAYNRLLEGNALTRD